MATFDVRNFDPRKALKELGMIDERGLDVMPPVVPPEVLPAHQKGLRVMPAPLAGVAPKKSILSRVTGGAMQTPGDMKNLGDGSDHTGMPSDYVLPAANDAVPVPIAGVQKMGPSDWLLRMSDGSLPTAAAKPIADSSLAGRLSAGVDQGQKVGGDIGGFSVDGKPMKTVDMGKLKTDREAGMYVSGPGGFMALGAKNPDGSLNYDRGNMPSNDWSAGGANALNAAAERKYNDEVASAKKFNDAQAEANNNRSIADYYTSLSSSPTTFSLPDSQRMQMAGAQFAAQEKANADSKAVAGQRYVADQGLAGHKLAAELGLAGHKFTASENRAGREFTASQRGLYEPNKAEAATIMGEANRESRIIAGRAQLMSKPEWATLSPVQQQDALTRLEMDSRKEEFVPGIAGKDASGSLWWKKPEVLATAGRAVPKEAAPAPGAQKAPNGKWYVQDKTRPGKYLQVGA
jgi:hypothetical protein